ncbi:Cupin superfamily protein [Amantichitinum ursilacus]|uniref:Cupin superfamily protein n=2 Tax=Amantichitinum ursilacus TaxID=857265 RepID=A0A0N1JTI1_9NEIS|nr:Cupin superfamily protein [Amantichitinum ursilacus]
METRQQMQVDHEWRRWLAENLILGSNPAELVGIMIHAGVDPETARAEIDQALASPYLAGAQRLKNRLAKREWILNSQRQLNRQRPAEIPRRHQLSTDEFFNDFYTTGRPVIITGMMDNWPAMQKWNLDYFAERAGDKMVEVQGARETDAQYEINKLQHKQTMRFADYLNQVKHAGRTNDFYMTANNTSQNRRELAVLWQDIVQIPEYLNTRSADQGFLWIGPAGTITPFHHDLTNNFMAQVIGRKHVLLMPACELPAVYNHEHCFTHVDGRDIDYNRYPLMRGAQVLECTLNPGEILFLPVGCWHFVEGLDISVTVSFINFKWDNDFTSFYPEQKAF